MGAAALSLLAISGLAGAQVALPEAVTEQGESIRTLYFVVFAIGVVVFVIVEAMILWVVFRYKRKSDDELPTQVAHNTTAEILWTGIPTVIVVVLFIVSFFVLQDIQAAADPDEDVVIVDVQGRQWPGPSTMACRSAPNFLNRSPRIQLTSSYISRIRPWWCRS